MEKYIDFDFIESPEDTIKLNNLYKNYEMIYKNFASKENVYPTKDKKVIAKLYELEDKIYTIGKRKLSDKERIILEIKRIENYIKKNKDIEPKILKKTKNELEHLINLVNQNCLENDDFIYYFKSKISIIQAYLGLNITFFVAALETYEDGIIMDKPLKKQR